MQITPRRPLNSDSPDGYMESDGDFVLNNLALCVSLLERLSEILEADDLCPSERIEQVYDLFE